MRFFTLALICFSLMLAAPLGASAKSKKDKGHEVIAKLLAKIAESAGDSVSNSTETEISDSEVMGDGNEVVQIESLTLNINIGDVVINKTSGGEGGDFAHRLLDLMGMAHEKMGMGMDGFDCDHDMCGFEGHHQDMPMGHPKMDMRMDNPHGNMPKGHPDMGKMKGLPEGHPKMDGHPKMEGHGGYHPFMEGHPKKDGMPKGHPRIEGHGDMMHGKGNHENPGFHPEVWEMLHEIPMDIDPEFFGMIMYIGEMAAKHPRIREHLEGVIERFENRDEDRRPHGR